MRLLIIPFLLLTTLYAQKVEKIEFDGLIHLSKIAALDAINLQEGMELDENKIDGAIKELYDYGYFEDIKVFFSDGVLRFELSERPVISKVDLIGYKQRDKESILKHLRLTRGVTYDPQRLSDAKRELLNLLEFEGYFDSVIEFEKTRVGNAIEVDIIVNRGEKVYIDSLKFMGNEAFTHKQIEKELKNRQRQSLGWLWGRNRGLMHLNELPNDEQRLRDLYMRHGYLDVEVEDGVLEVDFGSYKAKQVYKISEGQQYEVAEVSVVQEKEILDTDDLNFRLRSGDIFNIDRFRQDSEMLQDAFANEGYAYVRVIPDVVPNPDDGTVDITFYIEPNKKVYINDVIISGNDRTIDRVIRREVFLAPGDLYSKTDLRDSRNALNRTGYFSDIKINERRVAADKIDLEIEVIEQPTGSLVLGAGYGSYDGFIYNIEVSDRNIFGTGLDARVDFEKSSKRTSYNLGLTNPRVWDSRYSAGFTLFNREYTAFDYEERSQGGSLFVGRMLTRHLRANLRYLYVDYDMRYDDPNRGDESYDKGSLTPSISYNNTDSFYFPRQGVTFSTSMEFAGVNGDARFIKNNANFATFYGLQEHINYDLILRYKARGGYIEDRGNLHINEKFYLGGINTVRGYGSNSLSPRDADGYRTGGKRIFSNSVEASVPLIEDANMRLAFFYDYGMIGEDSFDEISRSSTGVAIEWLAPIGPIQFVFAKPLDKEDGDRTSTFEFTLGTNF